MSEHPSSKELTARCTACGMFVAADEYHPYAACLMFMACRCSTTVRANLDGVIDHGRRAASTDHEPPAAPDAYLVVVRSGGRREEFATLPRAQVMGEKPGAAVVLERGQELLSEIPLYRSAQPPSAPLHRTTCVGGEVYRGKYKMLTLDVPMDWEVRIGDEWEIRRAPSTKESSLAGGKGADATTAATEPVRRPASPPSHEKESAP